MNITIRKLGTKNIDPATRPIPNIDGGTKGDVTLEIAHTWRTRIERDKERKMRYATRAQTAWSE